MLASFPPGKSYYGVKVRQRTAFESLLKWEGDLEPSTLSATEDKMDGGEEQSAYTLLLCWTLPLGTRVQAQ